MSKIDYSTPYTNGKAGNPIPVYDAYPTSPPAQSHSITLADVARAWGVARYLIGVTVLILGWFAHVLWTGGWINTPVNNAVLNSVTAQQANENSFFHRKLETIDNSLTAHSAALGNLNGLMLVQAAAVARIEGKLEGILAHFPQDISASQAPSAPVAPPPAAAPSPRQTGKKRSQNSKPLPVSASTGGWFAQWMSTPAR
jgi:hypothetical protein